MKKIIGLSLAFCALPIYANINANQGVYLGGGLSFVHYSTPSGTSFSSALMPNFVYIRPVLGYRANDYVAIELSYNDIENDNNDPVTSNGINYGPDHLRLYFADVAGKLILPFENGWSVFGKLGATFVHQDVYNQFVVGEPPLVDSNTNNISPLIGAGLSFNFTEKFAIELNAEYIPASKSVQSIETGGLSINYTF